MANQVSDEINNYFKSKNWELRLYPEAQTKHFESIDSLLNFIHIEINFWTKIDSTITGRFQDARSLMFSAISPDNTTPQQIYQAKCNLDKGLQILNNSDKIDIDKLCVYSSTSAAIYLKSLKQHSPLLYDSAKDFLLSDNEYELISCRNGRREFVVGNKKGLLGILDAYYFQYMQESVKSYLKSQEIPLSEIQSKFNVLMDDYIAQRDKHKQEIDACVAERNKWIAESNSKFAAQLNDFKDNYGKEQDIWHKRIIELETLYEQKLMLEAPIRYWKHLKEKHSKTGFCFAIAAAAGSLVLMAILTLILYRFPATILNAEAWSLSSIKGSLILLTLTSIGIYIIHILAKFAISSYHLARDAEERGQLTYVFLALSKNKSIEDSKHKEIVLQALFSRADTGLLKGDHSPAMPGAGSIADLLKK